MFTCRQWTLRGTHCRNDHIHPQQYARVLQSWWRIITVHYLHHLNPAACRTILSIHKQTHKHTHTNLLMNTNSMVFLVLSTSDNTNKTIQFMLIHTHPPKWHTKCCCCWVGATTATVIGKWCSDRVLEKEKICCCWRATTAKWNEKLLLL